MIHRSIQINWIFFILFLLFPFSVDAQDGPGGIGNADGSDGQPELKLWLLPDSLDETDDQEIDTWNDFSGNDNHLTGAGSNGSPVFRENFINGHSGVQFQYDKSRAVINSFDMPSEAVSVFFVLRTDGTQRLSPLSYAASDNDDNEYMFISDHPGSGDFATFVNGNNYSEPFTYNDNDWKILTHQWRSDDGRMYLHENGTQIFNTTHQTGAAITSGGTLSIGAEQDALDGGYQSSDDFEDGEMAEVIIYGSSLKQAQRVVIENYLAQKYGLDANLATDHYQPGDASYSVAMTGMGKESDGAIEANAEGIHLSENGGLENGEYLMSAHDGTSNTEDEINTGSEVTNAGVDSAWNRSWYIDKTGNFNAKIAFDFGEGIDGKNPGELQYYELLYRDDLTDDYSTVTVAGKGVQNGDQIYFEVDDANLADGYYTLGSSDKDESPLTGVEGRTWYTLVSGDWDDWETWTLDPSGSLPDNPDQRTPSASDNVVILSGKTVTVNQDNVSASELTVEGRLDFQAHTGQTFGKINGGGRILLGADNFPTGADASHFYTPGEGEGTIVYYGNSYDLDQALECYDLEVNLDNASDQLTLLKSYTINGNLTINQGQLQVNDNSSTTDLAITVQEDLGIESDGSLLTGSANARHQLNLYGDFTNNGTAEFTNRASADYNNEASDGIVDVNFLSDNSNQSLYCNGTTNFYRIEIDKGSDATYQLEMEATDPSYFNLYGPADYEHPDDAQLTTNENALGLLRGTVRLKNNVDVPVLNNSVNYNVSKNARLWIDGGSIAKSEGTAIVPYGKILVSSGTLESTASSGITTRENGLVKVEGGTLSINQLRTSVFGDDNIGGYVQTGGTTNILGGSTSSEYYCFNLTYPGNVFNMSGGTLHVHEAEGKGGIFIASDEVNQNVTGGTVIAEISDGEDFEITSKAPFWNVIIRNSHSGTGKHILSEGDNVGSTDENLSVQDLHVLNDLTIETGTTRDDGTNVYGSYLDLVPDNTNAADLYIGGDLRIEDSAVLDVWAWDGTTNDDANAGSATVTFNSSKDAVLYVGDITTYTRELLDATMNISNNYLKRGPLNWQLPFYNLTIDKPKATLSLAAKKPGKGREIFKDGEWNNTPNPNRNSTNGGKNVTGYASRLLLINKDFKLLNGTFSQRDPFHDVTITEDDGGDWGSVGDPVSYGMVVIGSNFVNKDTCFVYDPGVTPKEGTIEFLSSNTTYQTIETEKGSYFGNFRMNTENGGGIKLTSDVHMGRLEYGGGVLDIGKHELKLDAMEFAATNRSEVSSGQFYFDENHYIRMEGNASDGGLSIKIPRNVTPTSLSYDEYKKVNEVFYREEWYHDNKEYNSDDYFWFLIGTDASGIDKYTPAICYFHNNGTTDGDEYVNINVVDSELQTTDLSGGDLLSYYWNVDYEGYDEGEEPTVSWMFQYDDDDIVGDEENYVPGKVQDDGDYNRSDDGDTSAVKHGGASDKEGDLLGGSPRNVLIYNGFGSSDSYAPDDDIENIDDPVFVDDDIQGNWKDAWPGAGFSLENANYTAGEANRFVGSPEVYYSKTDGYWHETTTWSTDSEDEHEGPSASDYPQVGDVAIIAGSTSNMNHSVIISEEASHPDDIKVAKLEFGGNSPILVIQTNGDLNSVDLGVVKGNTGTSSTIVREIAPSTYTLTADLNQWASINTNEFQYKSHQTSNFTLPSTFKEFPNLTIAGNRSGDKSGSPSFDVTIDHSFKVNADMAMRSLAYVRLKDGSTQTIDVAGDLKIATNNDAVLRFPETGLWTLNIAENLKLLVGSSPGFGEQAELIVDDDATIEHLLTIGKNIVVEERDDGVDNQDPKIDLYANNGGGGVKLIFNKENDGETKINNAGVGSLLVPSLYKIIINKGTDTTSTFAFNSNFTLNAHTSGAGVDKAIELQNGKLIFNDPNINVDLTTGDDDFYIPGTAGLEVRKGTANAKGNSGILLDGALDVTGGTVDMSGGDNYIEYSASGDASIRVTEGELTVGSQIRRGLTSTEGILNYQQSGGTVIVGNDAAPEDNRGVFEIVNDGSHFAHTGGDLYITRAQDNPSIASLYLEPQTTHFGEGSFIHFGHSNTPSDETMGIYSSVELPNVVVDNFDDSNPVLEQWTVPLTITDSLEIDAGATYDAKGLDLTMEGDLVANGTFSPSQNTTYFSGTGDQKIVGNTNFWNLTKDHNNTLTLDNAEATVSNELKLQTGIFDDGGHTLHAKGNVWMDATHNHTGKSDGIAFDGNELQVLQSNNGEAVFGKLTINNTGGADSIAVSVPKGNDIRVRDTLNMKRGVFDIDKNLLVLEENAAIIEGNPFSTHNMIQTNISFTDIGIKKYFPGITSDTSFIYPIGSGGKYTPVEFDITGINAGGSIRVKAADEIHPTITNDDEPCDNIIDSLNVLKYHWLMEAEGVSNFSGDVRMHYANGDVQVDNTLDNTSYDVSDYITARLLMNSIQWNKYDTESFKETDQQLEFSFSGADDEHISGDYTAGVEDQDGTCKGAIPDKVAAYVTVSDGDWTNEDIWDTYPESGDNVPSGGPRGAVAIIEHEVTLSRDYLVNYKTTIDSGDVVNGILKVDDTYGHRLGIVDGVGTLQVKRGDLPAGIYEEFFSDNGGTLDYSGTDDYDVLGGITQLNNLKFSGTGERRLSNLDAGLYGNLDIAGTDNSLQVINEHDKRLDIEGNITFSKGSFDAGSGTNALVRINGNTKQQVSGSFEQSNAFNDLEINNSSGLEVLDSIEINQTLTLTNGMVYLPDTALVTLNSTDSDALANAGSSRYIQGALRKRIGSEDSYTFAIGDTSRHGELELSSTGSSGPQYWEAQYYNNNPDNHGYDITSYASPLNEVSDNEYWRVKGPGSDSHVKIRWDDESVLPAETDDRDTDLHIAEYLGDQWESKGDDVTDNGVNAGKVQTNNTVNLEEHVFTLATEETAPKPTAKFVTKDTSICEGNAIELTVDLTEGDSWTLDIDENGTIKEYEPDASPFTFEVTSEASKSNDEGTYSIESVENQEGTSGNVYGDPVDVTVSLVPAPDILGENSVCQYSTPSYSVDDDAGHYYDWSLPDGGGEIISGAGTHEIVVKWEDFGTRSVEVAVGVAGTSNCEGVDNREVEVHETPEPDVTAPAQVCYPMAVDLDAGDAPTGSTTFSYSWTADPGIGSFDDPNSSKEQSYTPDDNPGQASIPVTFDVIIENDNKSGCSATGSVTTDIYRRPETGNTYHVPNDFDQ